MTISTGQVGLGVTINMGDGGSPEVFAALANVANIDGPGESVETVETTHLASTGGYREFRPHLKDAGEVTLTMHFDPTHATQDSTTGLKAKYDANTLTNFEIDLSTVFTGGENKVSFAAYVTNLGLAIAVDNIIERPVTLRVNGQPVWTTV